MKLSPAKTREKRTEQELRLQPFTLLSAIPVVLTVAAAITYTCVYSDGPAEMGWHAFFSGAVSLLAIILFAKVWRKEARRPFSFRARRLAWRAMFFGYLGVTVASIVLGVYFKASGSKLSGLVLSCVLGVPIGFILYRLSITNEELANKRPEGTQGKSSPSKPSQVPGAPHP